MIVNTAERFTQFDIDSSKCNIEIEYTIDKSKLTYNVFIIPIDDKHILIKYNSITFKINRTKSELNEVLMYLCSLFYNDYNERIMFEMEYGDMYDDSNCYYSFTLSHCDTILYDTRKNISYFLENKEFENNIINEMVSPLIYLTKTTYN